MPDSGLMLMQSCQIVINISDHKKTRKTHPEDRFLPSCSITYLEPLYSLFNSSNS